MLTARQAELLAFCFERGYYSIPRRTTLRMLGSELQLSTASLSLVLRRAEAKIVRRHMAEQAAGGRPSPAVAPVRLPGG